MTVNHDVTGSSPVGGATKVRRAIYGPFFHIINGSIINVGVRKIEPTKKI